jgi:hypothetical protein
MNDFKKIRLSPKFSKLRSIDAALIHKKSLRWLEKELKTPYIGKKVVISHHAPSIRSLPDHRRDKLTSSAYAVVSILRLEMMLNTPLADHIRARLQHLHEMAAAA